MTEDATTEDATTEAASQHRPLLPEEEKVGSDDPELESKIILEDSEERTDFPEQTRRDSSQSPPD